MNNLALEYLLFAFVACSGILQIAVAHARLRGLMFLKPPIAGYILGGVAVVGAFFWFFATADRNVRGIEGAEQLGLFFSATIMAVFFTLLLSSLINARAFSSPESKGDPPAKGLEALKAMTYLQAISRLFSAISQRKREG